LLAPIFQAEFVSFLITFLLTPFPHKAFRIASVSLVFLVVVVAIVGEITSRHYKDLIRRRLPALSAKATDSLYEITIQDIRINIFTREVTVTGLRMSVNLDVFQRRHAEGRTPHVVLDVTVPEVTVNGVKWKELAAERELTCRSVHFYKPEIRVQIMPEWLRRDSLITKKPPELQRVYAARIAIDEPQFDVRYGYGEDGFSVQTTGGQLRARDWDFHPNQPFDTTRFFGAGQAEVQLDGATFTYPGALYRYNMESIRFSSSNSSGAIKGLRILPTMSYEKMYERIGYRRDIYECNLPDVSVKGLAWKTLLARHILMVESMELNEPDLSIHYSKMPPIAGNRKPAYYPNQWLQKINLPLNIRNILLWDGAVRYSETNNKTGAVGTLEFGYIRGGIYNVTNRPEAVVNMPICRTIVKGKFMHRTDITAVIDLELSSPKGVFNLNGKISNLDASQIREPVQAMAIADVASLHIKDAYLHVAGDEDSTWGRFTILYDALRVKLQRWRPDDSDVHSRVFLSFLANKLLLYRENPVPGQQVRSVTTSVVRGSTRSFFSMIWKNIFQGCTLTAIRDEGAMDIVKRKAANKGKPKRRFFKGLFPK
jgi:hypothetical protein